MKEKEGGGTMLLKGEVLETGSREHEEEEVVLESAVKWMGGT